MQNAFFNSPIKYPCKELTHIKDKESLFKALEEDDDLARLQSLGFTINQIYGGLSKANQFIKDVCTEEAGQTTIAVSTIHKYKGLEADHVVIMGDFLRRDEDGNPIVEELEEEENLNLLYVAITRAKVKLELPWYIEEFLKEV